MGLKCKVCLFASTVKVPKGRRTLVVTDDGEPERGVDVEVIGIEEKCVVPRINSAEGEESGLESEYTEHAINTMQVYTYIASFPGPPPSFPSLAVQKSGENLVSFTCEHDIISKLRKFAEQAAFRVFSTDYVLNMLSV